MKNKVLEELVTDNPFVASHRLPVLASWYPQYSYFAAIVDPDESTKELWGMESPEEHDFLLVAAYNDYIIKRQQYYPSYLENMSRENIVDMDASINTTTFGKSAALGWQYHKRTWQHGPFPLKGDVKFENLIDLMDYLEKFIPARWEEYKNSHPEVFDK